MHTDNMLNDICKFATTQATAALSKFMQIPFTLDEHVTSLSFPIEWVDAHLSHDHTISFYLPISEGISGNAVLFYDERAAYKICDILYKRPLNTTQTLGKMEISALSELTNIFIGNFLTAMSSALQLDLLMHHVSIYDMGLFSEIYTRISHANYTKFKNNNLFFLARLKQGEISASMAFTCNYKEIRNLINKDARSAVGGEYVQ